LYQFKPRDFRADLNSTKRVLKTVPETTIFDRFSDCVAVYDRTLSNFGAREVPGNVKEPEPGAYLHTVLKLYEPTHEPAQNRTLHVYLKPCVTTLEP
jgi:hypothetical protein